MSNTKRILTDIALVVVVILIGVIACIISSKRSYHNGWQDALASIKPDTEYVEKKIYIDNPVPGEVIPAGKEMYPVGTVAQLKRVIDSLAAIKPDTTLVEIPVPMETKLYRDERDSTYEAQVTGYHATLDWIKVNQKTAYVTVPIPEYKYPSLIISPALDIMMFSEALGATAGIAVDYWHGGFQWTIEAGYGVFVHGGQTNTGWSGKIGAKYNLIRK